MGMIFFLLLGPLKNLTDSVNSVTLYYTLEIVYIVSAWAFYYFVIAPRIGGRS
jgi:hypothetical protein